MADPLSDVLIVGCGHAGAQTAIALRQLGFAGSIRMLGAEPGLPYERPPLSKEYLMGKRPAARLLLRPPAFWSEREIELRPGVRITNVAGDCAESAAGERFRFRHLVWATGGNARRLSCPGAGLPGVHQLRSLADCDSILADLGAARRVVIAGGGYIGLEVAAALVGRGLQVTLVETQPRLLARVAAPAIADFFRARHEQAGVSIRLQTSIAAILGNQRVAAVRLQDGEELAADLVVAGIGILPDSAPLHVKALEIDGHGRSALPGIYAAGDCALQRTRFSGGEAVRIESVQNATDTGKAVARHIHEGDSARPYSECPWFWSNQYDVRLQTVGLQHGHDETVVRGDPASGRWSLVYLRRGQVVALDCINLARDYVQGKALVELGARIAPSLLANPDVALKDLAGSASDHMGGASCTR